ncbi:uncharacterized protein LDX57_001844 [Aspergillus melleus]|uniref:uncharacterized protein n=1 Tax=Aspergillus melleus TaxID=138277 RepID=UPI001E8E81D9|nr:uncharacterized protein LDX57_001844 [Aspergillus melleus]KAH8424087.1 hypothetical protein LDX57_001844 [Aspergillus melleus]
MVYAPLWAAREQSQKNHSAHQLLEMFRSWSSSVYTSPWVVLDSSHEDYCVHQELKILGGPTSPWVPPVALQKQHHSAVIPDHGRGGRAPRWKRLGPTVAVNSNS